MVGTIETVGTVGTVEFIGVIQIQVQKMIDKDLEVGLEVEEELSRPVLIAKRQTMSCLTVIDLPKT